MAGAGFKPATLFLVTCLGGRDGHSITFYPVMDWEYVFASVAQFPKKATSLTWTDRTVNFLPSSPIPITRLGTFRVAHTAASVEVTGDMMTQELSCCGIIEVTRSHSDYHLSGL